MRLRIGAVTASLALLAMSASAQCATALPLQPKLQAATSKGTPAPQAHALDAADLEPWLDGRMTYALRAGEIAGVVVVVVKDGKVLLQKGYGYADVAKKIPMDPERTGVRSGSTTKLFTWTAIMQLVEQGKIDLDRDVNDYLDFKIPKRTRPITVRDLMNHRGGFEEGLKDVLAVDPKGLQSTEQYLKKHPRPLLFDAGDVPAYSNYGASLAGYIVERVSGEPYEQYVQRHILTPLAMNNTTLVQPLPDRFAASVSKGYRTAAGEPVPYELVVTRPAGSLTTTAADMSRFMLAHLGGGALEGRQILSPATEALMQTPTQKALRPGFATMAHGFFHQTRNGRTLIGHGGDTPVFHTELTLLPQEGVGIYFTFNSRGAQDAVYVARQELTDGFLDRYFPDQNPPVTPPALTTAVADAQEIAGLYEASRRVEHGFLSFFYLLQQTPIIANADGTITGPGPLDRGVAKFREIAPQVWREVGGTRELALTKVGGVKTVVDSDNPIAVLQATPFSRSSTLNLNLLLFSVAVLAGVVVLWGLSPLLRRGDRAQSSVTAKTRRLRLILRGAAAFDLAWAIGWYVVVQPVLSSSLEAYGPALDPIIGALELAGFLVVAAAGLGVWAAWRTFRSEATWLSRIWSAATALALVSFVWIGLMGQLIGFNLNY